MLSFEEFYRNKMNEDIGTAKTIGTRAARNTLPAIFEATYRAIRKNGICELTFTRNSDGATLHIASSNDDMSEDFDASLDLEWQEWVTKNSPSSIEIETAANHFVSVIKKAFNDFTDDEVILSDEELKRK